MKASALRSANLFQDALPPETGERVETLLRRGPLHVERIISSDRPDSTLYDQPQDEWVALLQGTATLWVDGTEIPLQTGDTLFLPAHTPHRVLRTSADPACVWLAVHLHPIKDTDAPA
ncbi:cupin domain-containing protein [Roseospira marina]|uniref:cupin domain-containing protein n=1 Tax=Roseospira marina TaxID=140057 RepID=UPI001823CC9A|nr:cupin domain-containing protein [Roseospira marina]MBB5086191.1 cupin 2 domain-containing protein [Roseospira marina]